MDRDQLIAAIEAQEQLRGSVPDDVVDTTLAVLQQRLRDLDAAQQRRRQVTVLFADVSGFTAMSEKADAEQVASVMNEMWARLDAVVAGHGGLVDKHIGDALMALWGAGGSREDDPEQAVRAALALLAALDDYRSDTGHGLEMRVGVHTGRAVVGEVGSAGEITAMGDSVNVASRLEGAAPVGGVLVSHDTYRHVRGVFDVRQLEPLEIRGRSDAVRAYEVRGVKPLTFRVPTRGVEGVETRMIGRDRELATLQNAFDDVDGASRCRQVLLVGEAGVGKSRLLYEFGNWVELEQRSAYYFKGRATARRQGTPFGLIREVVSARFSVNDSDDPDEVRKKLTAGLSAALDESEASLLGRWLGFELESSSSTEGRPLAVGSGVVGRALLLRYFRTLASNAPVVLLLEDLHWADDESLEVVVDLRQAMADAPMLVLAATRPEFFERRPDWMSAGQGAAQIDLGLLDVDDARSLVREILRVIDPVPLELVDIVAGRADGNPYYVEELVKMLVDDGVIDTRPEPWVLRMELLDQAQVPSTLTGVLQARLDAIELDARRALQRAAVVGRIFWSDAVASLAPTEQVRFDSALGRELIHERHPSVFPETHEYIFRHALLHDVAYESVLLSERPGLHAAAADWIERMARDRLDEYLVEVGEHHRRAGQPDRAASCFERAASAALRSGAIEASHQLATDAIEANGDVLSQALVRALVTAARCSRLRAQHAVAREEVMRAVERARDLRDDHEVCVALFEASLVLEAMGDHRECRTMLEEAAVVAARSPDEGDAANVYAGLAWSDLHGGDLVGATSYAAHSLVLAERSTLVEPMFRALAVSAAVAARTGDHRVATAAAERAAALCRSCGDVAGESVALCDLGVAWHLLGDAEGSTDAYRHADEAYRRSLQLCRDYGLVTGEGIALANLAQLSVRTGDPELAISLARESAAIHVRAGAGFDAYMAVLAHAEALAAIGEVDTAVEQVMAVRNGPSLGMFADEVSDILERLATEYGAEVVLREREVPDFDAVLTRVAQADDDAGVTELGSRDRM